MGNQLVWHITRQNENIQWRERGGTLLGRLLGMVQELADKMKECYSNVILLSPLEHIEFEEKDGTYTFDYSRFDK